MLKLPSAFLRHPAAAKVLTICLAVYIGYQFLAAPGAFPSPSSWIHGVAVLLLAGLGAVAFRHRPSKTVPWSSAAYLATIRKLIAAVDAGDPFSRGRSYRISKFCVSIGKHLGVSGTELEDLEYAALLHEIGKTAINLDIFQKPGGLNADERATVRTHPQIGYEILRDIPLLERAAEIILAHHEQPDGKGYPNGLQKRQIPRGAQIVMVVAAFDAMTSDRPYRQGLSPAEAYAELRKASGEMFVPEVVEACISLHESGRIFEEFDPEELELLSSTDHGSRAVEDYLRSCGRQGSPSVRGDDQAAA